ncbi:flagellar basal body-associated FliL family protein [Salipiger bermudensis]|uniref:flagellar basal body-associated FliL family protein n=1 Tax=Salipiger bermudensis TaxID=344736 RepID=UPI001A8C54BD|nr:flagellar basal body-associated FliL family protein [Salipiger bermudensis]MBN9677504.1 flagellar basal body-associated FliL family protein [Salipiger bermudensis]
MKKLLPILLAVIGTAAGIGAGLVLAPAPTAHDIAETASAGDGHDTSAHDGAGDHSDADDEDGEGGNEYVRLSNQFVVPVVGNDRVESLVVLSLSLEVGPGDTEAVFAQEPKLRDVFLRVLFDHANIGGFAGNFTEQHRMDRLRRALWEAARNVMGKIVFDVLITEIARQDS